MDTFIAIATRYDPYQSTTLDTFKLDAKAVAPKAVTKLQVVKGGRAGEYLVSWSIEEDDMKNVRGVFVIYGSRRASKVGSLLLAGPVTSVNLSVDSNLDMNDAVVSVSVLSKDGVVTPVDLAPEVRLP
ncbi:hypothetical protein CBS101457_005146 [Exobasidium rhododendri]|nr:hypothetical protein CBS101457_005146 [Exobasidium rhododendri]